MYLLLLALCVRICIIHFLLQLQSNGMRDNISSWGLFNNTFLFTISLPHPLPFICSLPLPLPLPILCTLPFPGSCLTALLVLLTLAVVCGDRLECGLQVGWFRVVRSGAACI
jgi:hypothetical protein